MIRELVRQREPAFKGLLELAVDIASLRRLPTLPAVAVRLLNYLNQSETDAAEIAEIVKYDAAVTAKLLRAASSLRACVSNPVTDLKRAILVLGTQKVTSLALCFSLSEGAMSPGPFAPLFRKVWLRSIVQAQTAMTLAVQFQAASPGHYYSAGLLCEIGALAILKSSPQEFHATVRESASHVLDHSSTSNLSADLLAHWGMPEEFCESIRNRWAPLSKLAEHDSSGSLNLRHAVAIAAAIAEYFCEEQKGYALIRIHELTESLLKMKEDEVRTLIATVQQAVTDSCELMDTDVTTWGPPSEILAIAMEQLSQLASESTDSKGTTSQISLENQHLRRRVADLLKRSITDPLTGLYNRAHFNEQLDLALRKARYDHSLLGIQFLDVDHFKKVNDTHGHATGDQVLKQVASVINSVVRECDLVARYGGEEIVILLPDITPELNWNIAERIRGHVASLEIMSQTGVIRPTVSIGCAVLADSPTEDSARALIETADRAMYLAKNNGRNRVETLLVASALQST